MTDKGLVEPPRVRVRLQQSYASTDATAARKVVALTFKNYSEYEWRAHRGAFAMKRHRSSRSYGTEIHRYFPEWADRPVGDGVLWESEQNSYPAGGYAEEFGYAAQLGLPAPAKHLNGDPECSKHWRTQIGGPPPRLP